MSNNLKTIVSAIGSAGGGLLAAAFVLLAVGVFAAACAPEDKGPPPELRWPEMAQCLRAQWFNGTSYAGRDAALAYCTGLLVKGPPYQWRNEQAYKDCVRQQWEAYRGYLYQRYAVLACRYDPDRAVETAPPGASMSQ